MNALGLDEQHALLKTVVERLEKCKIPYMVAGSVAANSYMPARTTNDIDIVIQLREADIDKLIEAFEDDFYINPREAILDSIKRYYPFNAISLSTAAKVDFVPTKPDLFDQTEFKRRRIVTVQGEKYWYITPEDYIISKLRTYVTTKSERQLRDLKNVLATQQGKLDLAYMLSWADHFKLRNELEALL
jgi:hypothetical protein